VILMRDGDVPPTVDAGVADAGRTGSDVIEELGHHLYEALDRGGGRGRRVLAGPLSRASRKPRPARGRAVGAAGAARRTVA
jgi:ATP phosphoribosyltransferase